MPGSIGSESSEATTDLETSGLDLPPRPSMSPLTQTRRLLFEPFSLLRDARRECGDLFVLDILGLGAVCCVARAEWLHEVYRHDDDAVRPGAARRDSLGRAGDPRSSFALDGEPYKRRRRITTPHLSGRRLNRWAPVLLELIERSIDSWTAGEEIVLQQTSNRVTRAIILRVLFDSLDEAERRRLDPLTCDYLVAMQRPTVLVPPLQKSFGPWSPWARFVKQRVALEETFESIVRRTVDAEIELGVEVDPKRDILSALVAGYREELRDAVRRDETVAMIVAELIFFVISGFETTAKSLCWTMLGLLEHPTALATLREELSRELGDRPLEATDVHQRLPYLQAVVLEGLRYQWLGPMVGARQVQRPIAIGGYRIDPGMTIVECPTELARRPETFPKPHQFEPDNFYTRDVKMTDWLPFGGGKRVCPGMGLAQLELAVSIATLARRCELEVVGTERDHRPRKAGIAFQPHDGLRLRYLGPFVG